MGEAGTPVRVFISYAHDDLDHVESVRRLWLLLRSLGVDAKLDVTATAQRQFWPEWMNEQIRSADFVLVVASPAYRERGEDRGDRSAGRGVRWEAPRLQERWYADPEAGLRSILPVMLPGGDADGLPDWLLPAGGTTFPIQELSEAGVEPLLRVLTGQPLEVETPLGDVPRLPPRSSELTDTRTRPAREALPTRLLIDARLEGERLTCEVSLAGVPVCSREAVLPIELDRLWECLSGPPVAAQQRLAAAGRALARVVFDEAGGRVVADLVAGLPPSDEVEVVWRADGGALALPVEVLALTTTAGELLGPLALIGGVGVRRQVRSPGGVREVTGLAGPLRVLAAVAAPEDTRTRNQPLDVEAEMQALLDSVGDLAAGPGGRVRILEVASLSQIRDALREAPFHVLHLSAHGSSTLVELEDEDGNPQPVGCRELISAIKDASAQVPLIVLSSCAGAAGGEALAAALVQAGADRVLAMQAPVTDAYATRLLAQFYRELVAPPGGGRAAGAATALARARRQLQRLHRTDEPLPLPEYAVATLLCAGTDPPLIDTGRPPEDMAVPATPSGTSVRQLGLGQLIGRRTQLREAVRALRRTPAAVERHGAISGVQLFGVGGIGKTALAGRLVTRLCGDGMLPVVHEGRWNPTALFTGLAAAIAATNPHDRLAAMLAAPGVPDTAKADLVGQLLKADRVLLVFDDFEQNLTTGGTGFLDPAFDEVFTGWCDSADTGIILVTCRYPLPGDDRYLVPVPVGPLSPAELRRLLLRLPALRGLTGEDLRLLTRTIGGHPRLIEYVDALLRGRPARFREVQTKLRDLAAREGINLRRPRPIGTAIEDALLLGGADILLDELLGLLSEHEREVLLQLSVSRAPMTPEDLLHALDEDEQSAEPMSAAHLVVEVEHLTDLTLLVPGDAVLVHPWTAELLERRPDTDRVRRHEQALRMRWRRLEQHRIGYDDLIDIARHLAATGQYGQLPGLAQQVVAALPGVLAGAAYLAEIRPLIPRTDPAWASVAKQEFEAVRTGGDLASARTLLLDLHQALQSRLNDPHDQRAPAQMSVLLVDLGDLAVSTGDLTTARGHYQGALDLHSSMSTDRRSEPWWQNRPAVIQSRLGDVAIAAGDLGAAREHYQAALDIGQDLAGTDPGDSGRQRDLSVSRNKLGDVAVAAGDLSAAREHYQVGLDIAQDLARTDPGNTGWQRDLSISRNKLGDVAVAAGDLSAAREHYQATLDITQRLARTDSGNTGWQRDLSISRDRLGDVAVAAGDPNTAREHYQAALDIRQRLAGTDPGNTSWQRDLSISRDRLGNVAVAAGDLGAAREHYQAGLDIRQWLAGTDPGNTGWQRDLSVSRNKLGDVAVAAGDPNTAREHYQAALDIGQDLAGTDPGNAEWQRDLSISHNKLGDVAVAAGDLSTAREHYQAALDIRQRLAGTDPGNTGWQRDLSVSRNKVGDVAARAGDLDTARQHYDAALDIAQRLTAADPSNTEWQRDLSISHDRLGTVAATAEDLSTAGEHYQAALDITLRLTATSPGNTEWQRDLTDIKGKLDRLVAD